MNIDHIATRFTDRLDPTPGDIALGHPYRTRWWLPVIGPTATCILTHLGEHDGGSSNWQITPAHELAITVGLGKGTGKNSPLIRSLERLTRFGFGRWDVEPGERCDPCINLYRTIRLVPERLTRNWPQSLQQAHAIDLAHMYRQTS